MPRIVDDQSESVMTSQAIGASSFHFTGVRIDRLEETEYTLVTIGVDVTGSVGGFEDRLHAAAVTAVKSCKKSPRKFNLLLRVFLFNTSVGISEVHGFKPLSDIDPDKDYPTWSVGGMTNLYDAVYSGVGAAVTYAESLTKNEYTANGITFIITDGDDNASKSTVGMIKSLADKAKKSEMIESHIGVLIGINAATYRQKLTQLAADADMRYIDVDDASEGKLAKLADFVSQSVSSQSQSLGTGGPSQSIAPTI